MLLKIYVAVLAQTTQVEGVVGLLSFNLHRLLRKHDFEGLLTVVDRRFRHKGHILFADLPLGRIMQHEYFFLLAIQFFFHHQEVLLNFIDFLKKLMKAHIRLSGILEKSIEVDLQQIDLIFYVVAPLDHHVV